MDELQIDAILRRSSKTKNFFKGVYSSDTLPNINDLPSCLVLNVDEKHEPGSHWTAIYLDVNGRGEYFDSYGLPPLSKHVVKFMETYSKPWTFNERQLQNAITTMCGPYTIFFLLYRCKYGLPMKETIQKMFPDEHAPLIQNDMKIQHSMKKRFGLFIPLIELDFVQQQMMRSKYLK